MFSLRSKAASCHSKYGCLFLCRFQLQSAGTVDFDAHFLLGTESKAANVWRHFLKGGMIPLLVGFLTPFNVIDSAHI